jgi:hypothetical protein
MAHLILIMVDAGWSHLSGYTNLQNTLNWGIAGVGVLLIPEVSPAPYSFMVHLVHSSI